MFKFYFKLQNKMLTKNLFYYIAFIVIVFNIAIRICPGKFISINKFGYAKIYDLKVIPREIFTYCDVYLLMMFLIIIFFFIGKDFNNSMEELTLCIGGSKINKFMVKKLFVIMSIHVSLYIITFINIYSIFLKFNNSYSKIMPLKEIIFYSITTNIFIISLGLFILFFTRDIAITTILITSYYFIEEALWRCKVTQQRGILAHLYQYEGYGAEYMVKTKLIYLGISVILLLITYNLSSRKRIFAIKK